MAEKVEQAKANPNIGVEDDFYTIRIGVDDLRITELMKDGRPTGERSIKFAKSYSATEVTAGKTFGVVGENGRIDGNFVGGIFKALTLSAKMVDPSAHSAKAAEKMLENFNKALKEHSLLVTEKTSRKGGITVKAQIEIADREVVTLAMLDQWEKSRTEVLLQVRFSPLAKTFEQMLKADEMNPDPDKRGNWFQSYLKVKQQLGQSSPENYLDTLTQMVKAGASSDELVSAAEKFKADLLAQKEGRKKAKLVKSEANLAAQAEFERLKEEARQAQALELLEVEEAA